MVLTEAMQVLWWGTAIAERTDITTLSDSQKSTAGVKAKRLFGRNALRSKYWKLLR